MEIWAKIFPWNLLISKTKIPTVILFKDLGIYTFENLKRNECVNILYEIAQNSSYQVFKSFKTTSACILTKIFKIYVRPKFEYNTQIWSPYLKKDNNKIKSV